MNKKSSIDKIFVSIFEDGTICSYIFTDSSKTSFSKLHQRNYFNGNVEFFVNSKDYNYPILLDGFVFPPDTNLFRPRQLQTIEMKAVPSTIKRKLTNWLKFQTK